MKTQASTWWAFIEPDLDDALEAFMSRYVQEGRASEASAAQLKSAVRNFLHSPEVGSRDLRRDGNTG